jgi:hypothetical protein
MASNSHGIRVHDSRGVRDSDSQETRVASIRVVNNHGIRATNGPSIRIASKIVLGPSARTTSYVNLFDPETEPLQPPIINLGSPPTLASGSTGVKIKRNIQVFIHVIESANKNYKEIVNAMREIKDVQLDIEQRSSNVQEHTFKEHLRYLNSCNKKIHKINQKMINMFSNLSIAMCHAFIKEHAHMPLVVDLPSNDSGSNELLDDQIEEAENIQPNDNML